MVILTRKCKFGETSSWQKLFLTLRQLSCTCCHAVRIIFVLLDSNYRLQGQWSSGQENVNLRYKCLAKIVPNIETVVLTMLPCCQDDLFPLRLQLQTLGTMVILTRKCQFGESSAWLKLLLTFRQLSWTCCNAVRIIFVLLDSNFRLQGLWSSWQENVNLERQVLGKSCS